MDSDLIDLLMAWQGQELGATRREQLLDRLARDEAFRRLFVAEIRTTGMLLAVQSTEPRWLQLQDELGWTNERLELDQENKLMRGIHRIPGRVRMPIAAWIGGGIAAVLVLVVIAGFAWQRRPAPVLVAAPALVEPGDPLALVVKLDAARWDPLLCPLLAEGLTLKTGRLRIASGRLTLSFFSGVILTVEGPADLDLVAMDRVFCRQGRLRARVPAGAEGFVVATPDSAVVDLGTEFGLNVDHDGKVQVMVFEGEAELAFLSAAGTPQRTQLVEEQRAFELDPRTGQIAETVANADGFVPAPRRDIPALVLDSDYPQEVLRCQPRNYWRFERLSAGVIPDEVPGGEPLRVTGPLSLSEGPEGIRCAVFEPGHPGQFLSIDSTWELTRETGHAVELWFLAESIRHASLVGLFPPVETVPEGPDRFIHVFFVELIASERQSLNKPASVRFLHRWPLDLKVGNNLFSESVYSPRRWHHVVAQKNGDRVELYFDGILSRSMPLVPDHPSLVCQLVVGRRTPESLNPKDNRAFIGRLDELALYDHPLSAEEVEKHYRMATQLVGSPVVIRDNERSP